MEPVLAAYAGDRVSLPEEGPSDAFVRRRFTTEPAGRRNRSQHSVKVAPAPVLSLDLVPLPPEEVQRRRKPGAGPGASTNRRSSPVVVEDHGRIDGAHHEAVGPVLIEGVVREMNHARDPFDEGAGSFAGQDVCLRSRIGGAHKANRAAGADIADRHVFSAQLVAMQANDVELSRCSTFETFQYLRQVVVDAEGRLRE